MNVKKITKVRGGNGKWELGNEEEWGSRRKCLTRIVKKVICLNEHSGQGAWGVGKQENEADENAKPGLCRW